jgi:hypothetical protein
VSGDRDEAPAAGPRDDTDELPPGARVEDEPDRSEHGDVDRQQPYDEEPMS